MQQLTYEQIYKKVLDHFVEEATWDDTPYGGYRDDKGRPRQLGCLIADEHYDPVVESVAVAEYFIISNEASWVKAVKSYTLKQSFLASGVPLYNHAIWIFLDNVQRMYYHKPKSKWFDLINDNYRKAEITAFFAAKNKANRELNSEETNYATNDN